MGQESSSKLSWQTLGRVDVSTLPEARLQLHWAAQIVASFGNAVLENREDDSQSNLGWVDALGALCSHPSPNGLSVGLRPADCTLLFLAPNNRIEARFELTGQTLQQGLGWLTSTYSTETGAVPPHSFLLPDYDMPSHPVAQGTPFSPQNVACFQEFQHWFGNANTVIYDLASRWRQASPVRCWPHHFDIATLITLDFGEAEEDARSVGCGMSPGDGTFNEPYFYVTPWPYPKQDQLPRLPVGFWHTRGWVGAILTASDFIQKKSNHTQPERVRLFLQTSTQACFNALGSSPS